MKITDIFKQTKRTFSFEFFPPKNLNAAVRFGINAGQLMKLNPSFVTGTYGAGGSTHEKTFDMVDLFNNSLNFTCMPHYTCVNATEEKIAYDMRVLKDNNIENIMLLRGDPPKDNPEALKNADGFNYASDLIQFVKKYYDHFAIGAAAYPEKHPEARTMDEDIRNLKYKVDSGVDFLVTQMFFDNEHYYRFLEKTQKAGINCRIIPAIMPITNYKQIKKFADISGAHIPESLQRRMEANLGRPNELYKIGLDFAIKQAHDLLEKGAPGLHFYTLNKCRAAVDLYESLADDYKEIRKNYEKSFSPHMPF